MADSIVKVESLSKIYSGKEVVKSISFEVKKGETFGILRPKGACKTATLEVIETLRPIDGGAVTIDGTRMIAAEGKHLTDIGLRLGSLDFIEVLNKSSTFWL